MNKLLKKVTRTYVTIYKQFLRWTKFTAFKLKDALSRNLSGSKHAKEKTTDQKVIKMVLKTAKS